MDWKSLTTLILSAVLSSNSKTKDLTAPVINGVIEAEALFGPDKGASKLAHVMPLAEDAITAFNAAPGSHPTLDPQSTLAAVQGAIATSIDVANTIAKAHGTPTTVPPTT